jgi:amino acid adenylation domain-containing protein/thioester reductase-like protein
VFVPLCSGGKLCIPDTDTILNPMELIQWIDTQKISLLHMVPSLFKVLSQQLESSNCFHSLKYILLAGELLRGNDLKKFVELFHERIRLVNVYGPSETTLAKLFFRIHENDILKPIIPVGKPIDHAEAVVLNNDRKPCMIGETGEIYIRTPFISSGYLNDTELTNKVFIKNPFGTNPRDLIYKTGDLGRMLPDGNIEVLERADNQVKIRGMKVDTKMVENIILGHEAVKDAVVIAKDDKNGNRYLCAYIIATRTFTAAELKKYLANDLPHYMIPSYMIQVEAFPLSPNGKLDRKALPEPADNMNTGVEYEAPSDMAEQQLAAIWQDILGLERVGVNDQFFELGGNSLKAMTLVAKIHKTFNARVPLSEIFKTQSLKDLATYIKSMQFSVYSSIRPAEEKEYYTLSAAQKRMYILSQLGDINSNYNISGVAVIEGELDKSHFEEAFKALLKRHESFRTSFEMAEGEPVQRIHQEVDFKPEFLRSTEDQVKEIIDNFIKRPFDLSRAPLLRIGIIELSNDKHVLMYVMPHIISDGTSIGIFVRELISIYKGDKLPELFIQYKDFSEWQNELFKTGIIQKQEEYWLKAFAGEVPVLNLPADYSRPAIQSFEGNTVKFNLGPEITAEINKLVRETGATLFMFLLAVYNVLLAKYTRQEDIVVGSPIAGRPHPDLEPIIGMFVNTLAMRNYPEGTKIFKGFLEEVRDNALKAYENQDYQFEELVEKLNLQRDLSRNPLFDTMFSLQNIDYGKSELRDLRITPYEYDSKAAKFDLTLRANEDESEISLELDYCTKLFKPETIQRLTGHFRNLVQAVIRNHQARLAELTVLSESEKRQLLDEFNSTKATYPIDMAIQTLFEAQAAQTPDYPAVVCGNQRLTYQELNEKANQLAGYLRKQGVKSNRIVGIMAGGSLEMFIGILGILKAGGAYLPIDPEYPKERIMYMLADSGAGILLTQSSLIEKAGRGSAIIDLNNHEIYDGISSNPELINQPHDLAYVIYTSGSTGKPKGVKIEHRSLVNLAKWHNEFFAVTPQDRSTKFAGFGFDASVWEIFPYLIIGATLHVIGDDLKLDIEKLNDYYERNQISISFLPTQFCEQFMGLDNRSLRVLLTGGDKLKHYEPKSYRLVNNYGPTENTVVSTSFFIDKENYDNIPIGKPIANVKTYVLDKNNQLQPIGVPGELCIAGVGLAAGYLNQPELTKDKFVDSSFEPGARMYRTGDLVRWLPDGNIEFLGRIDHQVKIRGFRIELGEIENELLQHENIKEVVVIDRQDIGTDKYLCAYIVAGGEPSVPELREYLAQKLPAYMIPSFFTFLDKLPLTPNGKIDRNMLPQPDRNVNADEDYTAPRNEIEKILAGVWEEVLGIQKIGIHHNFFELGGNSLKAIQVVTKLVTDFEINVTDIFKYPEIAILAEKITLKSNYLDSKIQEAVSFYKEAPKFNGKLIAKLLSRKVKYWQRWHEYQNKQFGRTNYQNILLTGSSGYLGIHLLYQLLTETDSNVYLLIRSNNIAGAERRLAPKMEYYFGASVYQQYKDRINVVNGDLSKDFFGVSPDVYRDLGAKIDCIIHAAANVKHYGWYEDFHEVNVKGTERLLDFAIQNQIGNFSFISTISVVAGAAEDGGMAFLTEYDTRLSEVTDSYYINSKIAAENMVLNARERGLNANIFRVGNLVFDSTSGKFQDNIAENAFYISIKSYIKLSRTPRIKLKTLDFSFVDYVAKAIVLLTTAKELSNETYHVFNRNLVSLHKIGELLSALEPSMRMLKVEDFYNYLRRNYDHPDLGAYSKNILMHSSVLRQHNQMKMFVFADKTNLILEKMNFKWPELSSDGMEKMLNHCKTVEFI